MHEAGICPGFFLAHGLGATYPSARRQRQKLRQRRISPAWRAGRLRRCSGPFEQPCGPLCASIPDRAGALRRARDGPVPRTGPLDAGLGTLVAFAGAGFACCSRLRARCARLGVRRPPSARGPPLCGVKIGVRAVGFAAHPLPPLPRFARSGIGRPDGLPRFHPSAPSLRAGRFGVRPYFFARFAHKKIDGPPPESGGPRAVPSGRHLAHRGFAPLLVTGRWGALPVTTGLRPCSRLTAGSPRVRPSRLGAGASCRAAALRSLRSLRLVPRSGLLAARFAVVGIPGAAPCWLAFGSRYPRL